MRVRVTRVLTREPLRVLFAGQVVGGGPRDGETVSFHVGLPNAARMADLVVQGEPVEVDL